NALSTERLTDRLQLDLRAGACQTTTRVAQAIESVQGLLSGARNGLLDGDDLAIDDPAAFDEVWSWLGSLTTWRAALRVFLHPENAAAPTLRHDASGAFRAVIKRLRDGGPYGGREGETAPEQARDGHGPLDPAAAQLEADAYERFLRDVCSLTFVA